MTGHSVFLNAIQRALIGSRTWFAVSGAIGLSVVVLGVASGIGAYIAYGSALLLPFLLAAFTGGMAIAELRHLSGEKSLGKQLWLLLLACFAWNVMCLSVAMLIDWFAARAGVLGREPNHFLDSTGMVLVLSAFFSLAVAVPAKSRK